MAKENEALAAARLDLGIKRGRAADAYRRFDAARRALAAGGTQAMKPTSKEFKALDQAGKVYDLACDERDAAERTYARLAEAVLAPTIGDVPNASGIDLTGFRAAFSRFTRENEIGDGQYDPNRIIEPSGWIPFVKKTEFTNLVSHASFPTPRYRLPGAEPAPQPNLALLSMIDFTPVENDVAEFMRETSYSANAAETAEGEAAPEATLTYEPATCQTREIDFHLPTTLQVLADDAALQAVLENQMTNGVLQRLQAQFIAGDGVAPNLAGILSTPDVLTRNIGEDSPSDAIQKAIADIRTATKSGYEPNVLLLSPADALGLGLAKQDATSDAYVIPPNAGRLWGLQPVVHVAVPTGTAIVGDTRSLSGLVRENIEVYITRSHSENWTKGIVDMLARGRWGLEVRCPVAWEQITNFGS
jgi:hypothetical protein